MMPIDIEGANIKLEKPEEWSDEIECVSMGALAGTDDNGLDFILTAWQPSKEDIDAVNEGRPLYLKVVGRRFPPMWIYTLDQNDNANL